MIDTTRACTYSARDTRAVRCVQCTEMGGGIREREVGFLGFSAKLCDERCFEILELGAPALSIALHRSTARVPCAK